MFGARSTKASSKRTTALGTAYLAGLATGFWHNLEEIANIWQLDRTFEPQITAIKREEMYAGWNEQWKGLGDGPSS